MTAGIYEYNVNKRSNIINNPYTMSKPKTLSVYAYIRKPLIHCNIYTKAKQYDVYLKLAAQPVEILSTFFP